MDASGNATGDNLKLWYALMIAEDSFLPPSQSRRLIINAFDHILDNAIYMISFRTGIKHCFS